LSVVSWLFYNYFAVFPVADHLSTAFIEQQNREGKSIATILKIKRKYKHTIRDDN